MKIKVGINGMGRIGRMIIRAIIENNYKNKILTETELVVALEASETNYWKKYTGTNGLNFGINDFGKSAPYKEIYNYFELNSESIIKKIKEKI